MSRIVVEHQAGVSARIRIGRHALLVDQPVEEHGRDLGPTPTDLFVAGLAACVEYYAGRFLARHGLDAHGLAVECDFSMAEERPARVARIDMVVRVPGDVLRIRPEALRAVVDHCTVHNSMRHSPEVRIVLEEERSPVSAGRGGR